MLKTKFWAIGLFLLSTISLAQTGARYLVIAHDTFVDAIRPLVEWKTKKGVKAVCVPLSQIGATPDQIKSYIQNAYNNWNPQPEYVLLVGSPNLLPSYNNAFDDYYADMTGNYQIELCIGRFPCPTVAKCSVMVAKTIGYEKSETMHDSTWFIKGTTIVREDVPPDPYYQSDCRYIRNLWLNYGNYIHVDSFLSTQGHNQDSVINAINNGRAFVVFRGQSVGSWYWPFNVNPNLTNNGYKLPIVVSGTCATITLAPNEAMLGDSFLRVGTVQNPKGAVGFFGTSQVGSNISQYRGAVTRGFFRALYEENIFTMGGAAKRGKFIMDSLYPNQTRYREWNLLGDPELNVWTSQPKKLTVVHDTILFLQPTIFPVTVSCSGAPVNQALVCVMMDSTIYAYDYTDSTGSVVFSITPQHPGTLAVTVTAHNRFPYEGSANVILRDVGVTEIVVPQGITDSTNPIIPQSRVKNYGTTIETFNITFRIGTTYYQTRSKTLGPGVEDTVNFSPWTPTRGSYLVRCSTHLVDNNPTNDTLSALVIVRVFDVGVSQIIAPSGHISSGVLVLPTVRATNYGTEIQTFPVYFRICSSQDTIYSDDTTVTIAGNQNATLYFSPWLSQPGFYHSFVCTALGGDFNPTNDTLSNNFTVGEAGWQRLADVPTTPSGQPLKNGSCLAPLAGKIYLLKANNTSDFYCFTPNSTIGNWTPLKSIPLGTKENGEGKNPKKGAAMTASNDAVYVLRGNNTSGFWRYTPFDDNWQKLKDIPAGSTNPKDGSGLVYVNKNGENCIFAMKGSKTTEFYLYFINGDSWRQLPPPSTGASGKPGYSKGSCLAYNGDSLVYVLKGNYGDFFQYNLLTNQWTELRRLDPKVFLNRENKKKKVKDGAGLVYFNGAIYLMKGGNTNEFWQYHIDDNTWLQMNPAEIWDIPMGGGKKVKSGGALCVLDNFFYATKGNKTCEFYRHGPPIHPQATKLNVPISIMGNKLPTDKIALMITPNPAKNVVTIKSEIATTQPVKIKFYRVTGELVDFKTCYSQGNFYIINISLLPSGIYFLQIETGKTTVNRKLVIEK
ncbi:MAG: C25 family cysteine peptidase [candidate division WOR-3 bacterium]